VGLETALIFYQFLMNASGLMTVAQLIVSDIVPLRERGKYQGILVSQ
jgi:MFS family permease